MKRYQLLKTTTNRWEYKILRTIDDDPYPYEGCSICPMYDHCSKYKHRKCKPNRIRERNWKSQRKFQRRNIK